MAVYLDDVLVRLEGGDLDAVLSSAQERLAPSGRIVVEVYYDGQPIQANQLSQRQQEAVEDHELRLYSADPCDLAITALQQANVQLQEATEVQTRSAELFQQDQKSEAMIQIVSMIDIWLQAHQAVLYSKQLLGVDFQDKAVDGQPVEEMVQGLIQQLQDLQDLLKAQDTVGLADVLAYEWPQTVEQWGRLITELIQWIQQQEESGENVHES